ncbi:MAG TPA: S4 domain-containing protein, partial [Dokdonella sp.]|uniref:S4 domain-containing protein n=1 Tax=Dokdonella sp. TaxID=2291710 RepID=UPI002D804344
MNATQPTLNASIPLESAGRRFDAALAELFPDYSRSRLSTWIKAGDVLLDGEQVIPRHIVHGGETVELKVRLQREVSARAEDIELDIR